MTVDVSTNDAFHWMEGIAAWCLIAENACTARSARGVSLENRSGIPDTFSASGSMIADGLPDAKTASRLRTSRILSMTSRCARLATAASARKATRWLCNGTTAVAMVGEPPGRCPGANGKRMVDVWMRGTVQPRRHRLIYAALAIEGSTAWG